MEESFGKYADRTAFVCMDKFMTYAELDELSKKVGAWLQSKDLKKGDENATGRGRETREPETTDAQTLWKPRFPFQRDKTATMTGRNSAAGLCSTRRNNAENPA